MKSLKQNVLYLAIMAGINVMCLAMRDIKAAQERALPPSGCMCDPSGSDGLSCPDKAGRLLCQGRANEPDAGK